MPEPGRAQGCGLVTTGRINARTVIVNPVIGLRTGVVPANAGTHSHRPLEYGSPLARGRQAWEPVDPSKLKPDYAASGRDIQRMSGIAGSTQPSPAST
jgi:hypothetical protein